MNCKATTLKGTVCKFPALDGKSFCHAHQNYRPSAAELEVRKAKVCEMLLQGKSKADLWRFVSENWGISERTLERYMADSLETLKQEGEKACEEAFSLAVARLQDLYKKNYKAGDYRECRLILESTISLTAKMKSEKDVPKRISGRLVVPKKNW